MCKTPGSADRRREPERRCACSMARETLHFVPKPKHGITVPTEGVAKCAKLRAPGGGGWIPEIPEILRKTRHFGRNSRAALEAGPAQPVGTELFHNSRNCGESAGGRTL